MSTPKVSVVINCYNSENYLLECLNSVLNQTYIHFEIIFWDNKSTDRSADIVKSINDSRIVYCMAEKHTSLGEARNLAVNLASNPWVAFIDCDDVWTENKLEDQIKSLKNSKNVGFVYSKAFLISDVNFNLNMKKYYENLLSNIVPHASTNLFKRLVFSNFIIFSSVLINKKAFIECGGIDYNLQQNEDLDILLKISFSYDAICCSGSNVGYRIHDNNNSNKNLELHFIEFNTILDSFPKSKLVVKSKLELNTKYAFFLVKNYRLFEGLKVLFKRGSFIYLFCKLIKVIKFK